MAIKVKKSEFVYSVPKLSLMKNYSDEIAFLGRSNAGKSSLINAVCSKRDLARTSKTPGRTRHAVVYSIAFAKDEQEKPFTLVDLPGFGFASMSKMEAKEAEGLLFSYVRKRVQLRMIVLLLDIRRQPDERERLIADIAHDRNIELLVVLTKCDKIALSKRKPALNTIARELGVAEPMIVLHSTFEERFAKELQEIIFNKI